jgi:hypothetical protein
MAPKTRIGWISHRALGKAAVAAATRAEAAGQGFDIAGLYRLLPQLPEAFAGDAGNAALGIGPESCAAWFARHELRG